MTTGHELEWPSTAIERSRDPDTWHTVSRPLIYITIIIDKYQ